MTTSTTSIAVDRIACTGHGLCADWLPEHIALDEWGYPILSGEEVPTELIAAARQAARQCPVRALRLPSRLTLRGETSHITAKNPLRLGRKSASHSQV